MDDPGPQQQGQLGYYLQLRAEEQEKKAALGDVSRAHSAKALKSLAGFVEQERHPAVAVLEAQVIEHGPADVTLGGDRTKLEVMSYGRDSAASKKYGHHAKFLDTLVARCLADAYAHALSHHGDDPSGTLRPFEREAAKDGVKDQGCGYWKLRAKVACEEEPRTVDARQRIEHAWSECEGWIRKAREAVEENG